MKNNLFYILPLALICSCNKDNSDNIDSRKTESELRHENTSSNSTVVIEESKTDNSHFIKYHTHAFQLTKVTPEKLMERPGNKTLSDEDKKTLKNELAFFFDVQRNDHKDLLSNSTLQDYDESIKYISFSIMNDFILIVDDKDTIKCSHSIFERTYNIKKGNRIVAFFSGLPDNYLTLELIYKDRLFGNGTMKFQFKENNIQLNTQQYDL